ncbi:MAG: thioredoxin family protein [Hymenobacter sp.]
MFGFSLALALPFTLFALFPSWLKALPKSGGWLNSVKVVLGFLELALALKFLSNVDLAYHWHGGLTARFSWRSGLLFSRYWAFICWAKFSFRTTARWSTCRCPGCFWPLSCWRSPPTWCRACGARRCKPWRVSYPPAHQDFDLYTPTLGGGGSSGPAVAPHEQHKYGDLFHAPLGLDAYFDYAEARAYAQKVNKPILIDFTGNACVNCRKMEATV